MPHQPALKLCATCDQVSLVRTTSRALRCRQRFAGRSCRSRDVRALSVPEFNTLRALEKAGYEGRIGDLEARVDRHEAELRDLRRLVEGLSRRP